MSRKLAESLGSLKVPPVDQAAVQLARRYAQLLDLARDDADEIKIYAELGPKYLATLTALGLTLAGRAAKTIEETSHAAVPGADELAKLRANRSTRANGA